MSTTETMEASNQHLSDAIKEAFDTVAPVWPLQDYVAVNPYFGINHRKFLDARSFLKVFSDCETLMPVDYYCEQFQRGRLDASDIDAAVKELASMNLEAPYTVPQITALLEKEVEVRTTLDQSGPEENSDRLIHTMAETVSKISSVNWVEAVRDEVARFCASHYDQGQATWASPWANLPVFEAWKQAAEHDRSLDAIGLKGFRTFAKNLPGDPAAAIEHSLKVMDVPQPLWSTVLLSQAYSVPGWSAWAKYQEAESGKSKGNDFVGVLAIRLAYDAALYKNYRPKVKWSQFISDGAACFPIPTSISGTESMLRYTLLKASEIGYRRQLLDSLPFSQPAEGNPAPQQSDRALAQIAFCIDVRSERIRRQLESVSKSVETYGFAGFFAMPIEFVSLAEPTGVNHLPVLLQPQFQLHEAVDDSAADAGSAVSYKESEAISQRVLIRSWRKMWRRFQTSAIGCFSFVETTGLFFGFKLLKRALGLPSSSEFRRDGVNSADVDSLAPTLRRLQDQGITLDQQTDLAQGMLNGLGITKNFARFVALCGHVSQTDNNPLAAGLDCGACGGHSGEPNARFAAMLLNLPDVRAELKKRGIEIPEDTHFLGGVHNTTTDQIQFFDLDALPPTHASDLKKLQDHCTAAGQQTVVERLPIVESNTVSHLLRRASDWSEVRPEWGLAGNAAFIVAPRALTENVNLDGKSFLHSYDHANDPEGAVLEVIMTAPMVVANWINMQYYASTVDNHHFGSGNKTVHNVVGRFGILSGNGGDLMTGLPWQSLHTGHDYQHLPLRLQVIIAAPRAAIQRIIDKHELVANLIVNEWLHVVALDDGNAYRFNSNREWEAIS